MMPSAAPFTNSKSKQTSGGGCGGTGATAGLLPPAQGLNCPRCNSPNTKFCYYNNYSLSQPRYFCKSCRRYWTKGGSLRNVPVGGGCRKSKKNSKSSSPSSLSSSSSSFSHLPLTVGAGAGGDNIPVTELTAAAAAASLDFHIHHNYSSIASSIESLSSMNQDLHWRLQQQRLAQVMYFGGGGGGAGEAQRQRQSTLTAVEAGNSTAAAETAWFLDGAFPAMNDDDGCRNGETGAAGEWTGIRDWSTVMPHFTVLP